MLYYLFICVSNTRDVLNCCANSLMKICDLHPFFFIVSFPSFYLSLFFPLSLSSEKIQRKHLIKVNMPSL